MTLSQLSNYGPSFQLKIITSLLNNKGFLINIADVIYIDYFDNSGHKWLIQNILDYYSKYHTVPTLDYLKMEVKKVENESLRSSILQQLREALQLEKEDLTWVQDEFTNFCINQKLKQALLTSVDLLKEGEYETIKELINNALKSGQDKNIGHIYTKDLESRYREDARNPIPTPWEEFNDLFQGGLGKGDFGLIFGNPGGGKSWAMIAMAVHAAKLGYKVLYYTLELSEDYIGKRFDACLTGIPFVKVNSQKSTISQMIEKLPGEIIVAEFPPGKASISTIENHIEKCKDFDFEPDIIFIDYVDLLSTKKKTTDRKGEIDDIYISTKGLAKQLKIPIWSVSQVNRQGAKDNIIEGDKAAGSYDKIMITDVCISLSRKKEDKVNKTGRFHIMKNRYGMDGMSYNALVDTNVGHFEILDTEVILSEDNSDTDYFNKREKEKLKSEFDNFFELNK